MPRLALVDGSRGLHYADRMFKKPIFIAIHCFKTLDEKPEPAALHAYRQEREAALLLAFGDDCVQVG
jgi:hypothetical protein